MKCRHGSIELELAYVIVSSGLASKVLKCAKASGVTGGTIFLGKGTVKNPVLEFLGLTEVRREVVLMVAEKNTARSALERLDEKFKFSKPNHGIAFTTTACALYGAKDLSYEEIKVNREVGKPMYNAIFTIVDRGRGELVVEAANKAGARGATIIHARGSGIHETSTLFDMEIEPEKEIVMIIAEEATTDPIIASIREELEIDLPGKGIIFVQPVAKTYGMCK